MLLPKKYLSYSAWNLWLTNKNAFRKRYYENVKTIASPEMLFGKEVAKLLEKKKLLHIPRLEIAEHPIEIMIGDIPILGYLDSFSEKDKKFLEYKTGHLTPNGKPFWNNVTVAKHTQLPFYSLMIKTRYGSVDNHCQLIWLETEFKKKKIKFQKHTLTAISRELCLTGNVEIFDRKITEYERQKVKKSIIETAKEISEDYKSYQQLSS